MKTAPLFPLLGPGWVLGGEGGEGTGRRGGRCVYRGGGYCFCWMEERVVRVCAGRQNTLLGTVDSNVVMLCRTKTVCALLGTRVRTLKQTV